MANQTQPLNLTDFTGGLNLRANEFNLADNESPDMLNVEIDPRGGLYSRKGWERWDDVDGVAPSADWDPRSAWVHELASGQDVVVVSNNGTLRYSSNGTFATVQDTGVDVVVSADPHLADFASWGDTLYVAAGINNDSLKCDASMDATALTADAWNNDDLSPGSGRMPRANFIASHASRVWVANTKESGTHYPNRVRWSFSNVPESWAETDYIDILEGGGPITAIVPHEDHLLIFKQSSVWALYGYDRDSQQLVNVSRRVGAFSRQVVAWSPDAVYFVSWPDGVFMISRGQLRETSERLRPAFTSPDFNQAAIGNMWLGWLGQRLWFAVPYWEDGAADDARSIFVLDPSMGEQGSWTMFRSSQDEGLGPFVQGGYGQGSYDLYGFCRCGPHVVKVDSRQAASDTIVGSAVAFDTRYTTRWLHAGWPERKKRWRRPTFIVSNEAETYTLKCKVYVDFDESTAKRQFDVIVNGPDGLLLYDDGVLYDDDQLYGEKVEGAQLKRASGFGSARAVQLQIDGQAGQAWRLEGLVAKYRHRRFT